MSKETVRKGNPVRMDKDFSSERVIRPGMVESVDDLVVGGKYISMYVDEDGPRKVWEIEVTSKDHESYKAKFRNREGKIIEGEFDYAGMGLEDRKGMWCTTRYLVPKKDL